MVKFIKVLLILVAAYNLSVAQPTTFHYAYTNGYTGRSVVQAPNGDYLSAGSTDFYINWEWMMTSDPATTDVIFMRTDREGAVIWQKTYGTPGAREYATWVEPTNDNGWIMVGNYSTEAQFFPFPDSNDILLIKTDQNGVLEWSKIYDTGGDEYGYHVQVTSDGGFIIAGFHQDFPGAGAPSFILIKTDDMGNVQWEKIYDKHARYPFMNGRPFPLKVKETSDGGYIVINTSTSTHVSGDIFVTKLSVDGDVEWRRSYDNIDLGKMATGADIIEIQPVGSGYMICGSVDKVPIFEINFPFVLRIDNAGNMITYDFWGNNPPDMIETGFSTVLQASDGNFVFSGKSGYNDVGMHAHLLKTDLALNEIWGRNYDDMDGIDLTTSRDFIQTQDGGYLICGLRGWWGGLGLWKVDDVGLIDCKTPNPLLNYSTTMVQFAHPVSVTSGIAVTPFFPAEAPMVELPFEVCPVILPVGLISFKAKQIEDAVQLTWETTEASDNQTFIVERSNNGINFNALGFDYTELDLRSFEIVDNNPTSGMNYYRLKMIDMDGKQSYSKQVHCQFDKLGFELTWDAVKSQLLVSYDTESFEDVITISIYTINGKRIQELNVDRGSQNIKLNTLTTGFYFAKANAGLQSKALKIFIP